MIREDWYPKNKSEFMKKFQEMDEEMLAAMLAYLYSLDEMRRPTSVQRTLAIKSTRPSAKAEFGLNNALKRGVLKAIDESYRNDRKILQAMQKKPHKPGIRLDLTLCAAYLALYQDSYQKELYRTLSQKNWKEETRKFVRDGADLRLSTKTKMNAFSAFSMLLEELQCKHGRAVTNELIKQYGFNKVIVSAHAGARTGDGRPTEANHEWWQGQVYCIRGSESGYPNLTDVTGYDLLTDTPSRLGLYGINCRHTHVPWDEHLPQSLVNEMLMDTSSKYNPDQLRTQRMMERRILSMRRLMIFDRAFGGVTPSQMREYRSYVDKYLHYVRTWGLTPNILF